MDTLRRGLVAVSGGIGSGKSVVCSALRCMGYDVYDCDSRAREIMDTSAELKERIAREVLAEAIRDDMTIDRKALGAAVFNDREKLRRLNAIVHASVLADLRRWSAERASSLRFVETAILYQSGIDRIVDEVWEVTAPDAVRVERVCRRNGLTPEEVKARIDSQMHVAERRHPHEHPIVNDGVESLLLQLDALLRGLSR